MTSRWHSPRMKNLEDKFPLKRENIDRIDDVLNKSIQPQDEQKAVELRTNSNHTPLTECELINFCRSTSLKWKMHVSSILNVTRKKLNTFRWHTFATFYLFWVAEAGSSNTKRCEFNPGRHHSIQFTFQMEIKNRKDEETPKGVEAYECRIMKTFLFWNNRHRCNEAITLTKCQFLRDDAVLRIKDARDPVARTSNQRIAQFQASQSIRKRMERSNGSPSCAGLQHDGNILSLNFVQRWEIKVEAATSA